MAPPLKSDELDPGAKGASKTAVSTALLGSIVLHGVIAVVAGIWVVASYIQQEPPQFVAPPAPKIKIPPQTRQHRMNLAAHTGLASKPTFQHRLVSLRPTAFALPEAPKISMDNLLVPDPSQMATSLVTGLAGAAGTGAGAGFGLGGAGGKGLGSGLNFMGIQSQGEKVLLLFDVSRSVVNKAEASGVPLAKIREETNLLLSKLPANARFGLIQFVRNYKPFKSELIAATNPNREEAKRWMESQWSESGQMPRGGAGVISPDPNGFSEVLRAGFAMQPEVIFVISDGSFEQGVETSRKIPEDEFESLLKDLQGSLQKKVAIHFIGFQMKEEDQAFWSKIVRRYDGEMKEIH